MGGRGGPGPRRAFDEPEDVEFVKVMKGHARQVTSLAFDHSSSQVRQPVSECCLHKIQGSKLDMAWVTRPYQATPTHRCV